MPVRITPLVSGEYYHILNRGIARQPVFFSKSNYKQMLLDLSYYRFTTPPVKLSLFKTLSLEQRDYLWRELKKKDERLVDILCYSLMPNHFHLLLRQEKDGGISRFMSRLTNSYTRFFNTKSQRNGPLFQGAFKAVHIGTTDQLVHVSRYIHINPVVSYVIREDQLDTYPWTSFKEYLDGPTLVNSQPILENFKSIDAYKEFVFDQVDYGKSLEVIKHVALE
ncbi:MAG: transposase [Patescibacteria group bacterium]